MGLFSSFFGKKSASNAKERLKLVLIHDRVNMNNGTLELLKDEIIAVISKHLDIDPNMVKIDFETQGRSQKLVADIPFRSSPTKKNR
jgi:cell division topological specificity factor